MIMDSDSVRGIGRRRLLRWGGLAAGASLAGAWPGRAASAATGPGPSGDDRIPPGTRPGGAYDQYVAGLAAKGLFSGVVLLSHQGRTVLSRSYGMADKEKGIPNGEDIAFNLSSAGKPFGAVAIMQLVQQGKVQLLDTVGTHLTGFAPDIAKQVTIHEMLSGSSGLNDPDVDVQRIFYSREEVQEYYEQWAQSAQLVGTPGIPDPLHAGPNIEIPALVVEAVTGMTYWDYVQEHVFARCGMTGSAFYTRPQWLTDPHIAHPYMTLADGSVVDAIRNHGDSSPDPDDLGENPGRSFIDPPGDGGFVTAPDLVRFARALGDGTLLGRPYADLLTGAKFPQSAGSFMAYDIPVHIVGGQWVYERGGAGPGIGANWDIYPDTGWVGVILGNCDNIPLVEMLQQEMQAVTGQAVSGAGGG